MHRGLHVLLHKGEEFVMMADCVTSVIHLFYHDPDAPLSARFSSVIIARWGENVNFKRINQDARAVDDAARDRITVAGLQHAHLFTDAHLDLTKHDIADLIVHMAVRGNLDAAFKEKLAEHGLIGCCHCAPMNAFGHLDLIRVFWRYKIIISHVLIHPLLMPAVHHDSIVAISNG